MMVDNLSIFNFSKVVKKRIISIVTFVIILYSLDFVIGSTLRYLYFNEKSGFQFRTTYAMDSTKAYILVFGSSRASHHYFPEVFEDSLKMTFYNTGRDGIGILVQTAILKSVLKRYTPKIIILDCFGDFEANKNSFDGPAFLLPCYRTHEEVRKTIELNDSFERVKLISEIYPFNSQILSIVSGNLKVSKKRITDNKGYIPLYKEWQAGIDSIETYKTHPIDSVIKNTFREFISIAKKSGAKVFIVYSPIFEKYGKKRAIEICTDICNSENVPFWDYSKDTLFLNNRHLFQDVLHLNNNGAKIFSNIIAEKIKDNIYQSQPNGNPGQPILKMKSH